MKLLLLFTGVTGENMKILLISGFLGAGKTSFIKQLAKMVGGNIAVMENEYGDLGVDGEILKDESLNVWELTEGCICCSVKSDFASSILTIANSVDPEYLIVEPTGVGMLSRVIENIRLIEYERIELLSPLTIIDPGSFRRYIREYGSIYRDQIESAGRIVLSKLDKGCPVDIAELADELRALNPEAELVLEPYQNKAADWWQGLLYGDGEKGANKPNEGDAIRLYEREAELKSISVKEAELGSVYELCSFLELLVRGYYGNIIRAKGIIRGGQELLRFDVVDRSYSIIGADDDDETGAVFIGSNIAEELLKERLSPELKKGASRGVRRKIGYYGSVV